MLSGCMDEKTLQARRLQIQQEEQKEKERVRIRKKPFDILSAESTRKKGSGEITVRWESNRDIPLKLDVEDKNGDGITYNIKPRCFENGHCFYDVSFHVPMGRSAYLTFYDPRGKIVLEWTIHVPDLETMVLTDEVF